MLMYAGPDFLAAYHAELTRADWLKRGANWRRAKREANKSLRRSWREAAIARLDAFAGLRPDSRPIDRAPLGWWRNSALNNPLTGDTV